MKNEVRQTENKTNKNNAFARIELRRFFEYGRLALNKDVLMDQLSSLLEKYDLTQDDIKFNNDYVYGGELDD